MFLVELLTEATTRNKKKETLLFWIPETRYSRVDPWVKGTLAALINMFYVCGTTLIHVTCSLRPVQINMVPYI